MFVKPIGQSPIPSNMSFEIKSAQLPLVALLLKTQRWEVIAADLSKQYGVLGESPDFFEQDPVVLDFSGVPRETDWTDIRFLLDTMRACCLVPLAFRGEPATWTKFLLKTGLVQAPVEVNKANKPVAKVVATTPPLVSDIQAPATMVIDKPVRSGQKIYARGGDLVVLAMVNQGGEVVADGNIHVYAPLRGKAMAGARGNASARIFSLCLEPELISIAGVYRTSENPLPVDVAGKPAQVRLSSDDGQDRLLIESLKN